MTPSAAATTGWPALPAMSRPWRFGSPDTKRPMTWPWVGQRQVPLAGAASGTAGRAGVAAGRAGVATGVAGVEGVAAGVAGRAGVVPRDPEGGGVRGAGMPVTPAVVRACD